MTESIEVKTSKRWNPIMLIQVYRCTRLGMSDVDVCKELQVSRQTYYKWLKQKKELKEAVAIGEQELNTGKSFADYVYEKLSPQLKETWNQIKEWEEEDNGVAKIELMLEDKGVKVRQQLFLHALVDGGFSPSVALSRVNITKKTLDKWIREDPSFAELVSEIDWHKSNFFEGGLVRLVKEGNPAATIFANRTINKTRGYGLTQQVDVNVSGQVVVGVVDLNELADVLSPACKIELMEAVRLMEVKKNALPSTPGEIISSKIAAAAESYLLNGE